MATLKASVTTVGRRPQAHSVHSQEPLAYPATWDTIEDEELPRLDPRLASRMRLTEKSAALDRLEAVVGERLRRRVAAHAAATAALISAGADPDNMPVAAPRSGTMSLTRWISPTAFPFLTGRNQHVEQLRGVLLLQTLALEILRALSRAIVEERYGKTVGGPLADPLLGAVGSLFGGFNTAYLVSEHVYQAELLAAAAWLGWRIEGRSAPLPAAAAAQLTEAGTKHWLCADLPDLALDPAVVLALGLRMSGIDPGRIASRASDAWPAHNLARARRLSAADVVLCRRLLSRLERLAKPVN